jgi:hypothetical protein
MDRFAANTLRTLGIVLTSIFVIVCCLALLLLALCIGMLSNVGGGGGFHSSQDSNLFYGSIMGAIAMAVIGILVIAKLARGIVREPAGLNAAALSVWGRASRPSSPDAATDPEQSVPLSSDQRDSIPPDSTRPPTAQLPTPAPPSTPHPRPHDVVSHLSPASRAAIQRLVTAIAAQVVLGTLGWQWALRATVTPFHPNRLTPFVSGFASNLPYLVLLLSLLRQPGRRAFAYALTIPSILLLSGIFSSSAIIFYMFRTAHASLSFLSVLLLIPWALHILILYLAWQAIRLTGILPNPARLIASAAVTFCYYVFVLPALLVALNYLLR